MLSGVKTTTNTTRYSAENNLNKYDMVFAPEANVPIVTKKIFPSNVMCNFMYINCLNIFAL